MCINYALLGFYLCHFLEGMNVLKDLIVYDQKSYQILKKYIITLEMTFQFFCYPQKLQHFILIVFHYVTCFTDM